MADRLLSTTTLRSLGKRKCLIQCGATWSAILQQVSQFKGSEASCLIDAVFSKAMGPSSYLEHTAGDLYVHIDQAAWLLLTLIYSISIY